MLDSLNLDMLICKDTYLDIEELLCKYWWALIDWGSGTIEHSAKHFDTHWHPEHIAGEFASGAQVVDV